MRLSVLAGIMGGVATPVAILLAGGVCWAGQSVEGALNDLVGGSTINGRAVLISRGVWLRACHLVYLGLADRERIASILDELQGATVLTVSNGYEFARLGGIVALLVDEGRMRFAHQSRSRAARRTPSELAPASTGQDSHGRSS